MVPGAALILVVLALVVPSFLVLTWLVSCYHRLSGLSRAYLQSYGQLDAVLEQRYDLILDLVETSKGFLGQDLGMPEALLAARNAASAARLLTARAPGDVSAMQNLAGTEAALTGTLRRLFSLAKEHPDFNTDAAMLRLRTELEASDPLVAAAIQSFNETVLRYNSVRGGFPNNVIAVPFGFAAAEPLAVRMPDGVRTPASGVFTGGQN
jgi:LemA protein